MDLRLVVRQERAFALYRSKFVFLRHTVPVRPVCFVEILKLRQREHKLLLWLMLYPAREISNYAQKCLIVK